MKQLSEVSYLRCFAVIMIVLWHCYFCPVICWPVFDNANANNLYMMAMRVVGLFAFPDCVMPLFTFLSGYLFYYLFKEKNKYQDFKPFFINKLNRLFIPFLVLGSVISITSPDRYLEQVLWGEGSALWFSAMLFWCFLLAWVPLYIKSFSISMLFFLTSLAFNAYSISVWTTPCELILGLDNSLFYLHYFIAGEIAYKYRDSIYEIFNKKLLLLLIILYVAVAAAILIKIPLIIHLRTIIQSYLFILIALRISLNFSTREIPIGGGIYTFTRYSFGIFVFHEWFSWFVVHIPYFNRMLHEHYILYPILNTIIILTISYYLTALFIKTKVGRYLLL